VDGTYRKATVAKDYGYLKYNEGNKLYFNYRAAGVNPAAFPDPHTIDPTRPIDSYKSLQGDTVFKVLGQDFVYGAAANVLRAVFSLNNVRRANGAAGTLRRFKETFIAPPNQLKPTPVTVEEIILGDDGKPVKQDSPKSVQINKYSWVNTQILDPAEGDVNTAWKYKYCNPEDDHRITQWATGLTLNVRFTHSPVLNHWFPDLGCFVSCRSSSTTNEYDDNALVMYLMSTLR
jgi:linoleate 10R-lipoxygenase